MAAQLRSSFVSKSLTSGELNKLRLDHCDAEFGALLARWFSSSEPCCFSDVRFSSRHDQVKLYSIV